MKCFKHASTDAVAVCSWCGRALCRDCIPPAPASRILCSTECLDAASRQENALQTLLYSTARSAKASAFYCYLCAALSAGAALVAWFMLPSPFLILFTSACAVVLFVSGLWYGRAAKRRTL